MYASTYRDFAGSGYVHRLVVQDGPSDNGGGGALTTTTTAISDTGTARKLYEVYIRLLLLLFISHC